MNKVLKKWDYATDKLALEFIKKYFGNPEDYDFWWLGRDDEDKGVLGVNDYYFNLERIVDALRYKATKKQLFDYYDAELEENPPKINFKNYIKGLK